MIEGLIALGVLLAGPPLMLPWAALAVPHDSRGAWALRIGLALALCAGLIWAIMLAFGLVNIPLNAVWVMIVLGIVALAGALAARGRIGWSPPRLPDSLLERIVMALMLMLCAAILFNGLYFPLYRDDAINIYGPQAAEIARTESLIPLRGVDTLYRAYPMLVQFNMAFAYDLAGWQNDSLAKLIPTLLSLGCVVAIYGVSVQFLSSRAAWLNVLMLAMIPAVGRWASAGYVDLPMAFCYTLGAAFLIRLLQTNNLRDAVAAGLLFGLAAQVKNAGLIGVVLLGLGLGWGVLSRKISLLSGALAFGVCAAVTAPWYLRNLIDAGMIIPPTAWVDQAERTVASLLIFVTLTNNFGVVGVGLLASLVLLPLSWLIRPGRFTLDEATRSAFQLIALLTLPFFAAWWLFASYDPRFLLLFTPLLCVPIGWALTRPMSLSVPRMLQRAGLVVAIAFILFNTYHSVDYKDDILRNPLMDYDDKLMLVGRTPAGFTPPVSP